MKLRRPEVSAREAVRHATGRARREGYALVIERAPDCAPYTHSAAVRRLGPKNAPLRFLTHANSASAAATAGLKILLSVLRGDDLWPEGSTRPAAEPPRPTHGTVPPDPST